MPRASEKTTASRSGQRSFTAAELTALALALDTSVQVLFRAEAGPVELPGQVVSSEQYRGIVLSRDNDAPLDGVEEMIIALHDIGEVLSRPSLARLARITRTDLDRLAVVAQYRVSDGQLVETVQQVADRIDEVMSDGAEFSAR